MQPAIAVITAPRPRPTCDATLREIRWGGFSGSVHVFAEPGSVVSEQSGVVLHRNPVRLGMWRNWLSAARDLLRSTSAERLLIVEDDVQFAHGAAAALANGFAALPLPSLGFMSLYTPANNAWQRSLQYGWQPLASGHVCWGSLALAFTRESLSAILHSRTALLHSRPNETDYILSTAALELDRSICHHFPSLCAHEAADNSSVGNHSQASTRAVGFDADFHPQVGEIYAASSPYSTLSPFVE